jgi:hypothetical protein
VQRVVADDARGQARRYGAHRGPPALMDERKEASASRNGTEIGREGRQRCGLEYFMSTI